MGGSISTAYRRKVGGDLSKYGLRFEDTLIETPDVTKAIALMTPVEQHERTKRMMMAIDCDLKKVHLPEAMQRDFDPWAGRLCDLVEQVKNERVEQERAQLE
jgi:hypothetical protein